ncbi:hypothetical protein [Variovorax paradoxus]|uniref:hypothetical protein n=1 Tax=Variovorax paradoxus TaxID=34073 RepID=UPI002783FEEC|nr:hypothetical protein [Variovorax paradoxus]MDQ0591357.1 hypothetical protein [Variovorax paradoxus]
MRAQIAAACAEADGLQEDRLLNTDVEGLVGYFLEKYEVTVPTLDRAGMEGSHHEREFEHFDIWDKRTIMVPGEAYDFEVPFTGEPSIFKMQPNAYDTSPPLAVVAGKTLRFTVAGRTLAPEAVKQQVDMLLDSIEKYLLWHQSMWASYPDQLSREVRQRIEVRSARLLHQKGSVAALSGLGIKIKEKPGDARTFVPPVVKQKVQPQLPPMKPSRPPEPTLDKAVYENILGIVRGAGRSIEQSSSRTRSLDEESLRDMFLVPLNAHFGNATGEAFNVTGKTDILIRHETGNIFVAEFKIWGGEKRFIATIDQLLGYLSWRDTRTAIVMFNRNAGFSGVVAKMRELVKTHVNYVNGPVRLDETSDSYTFSLPQDKDRHITIALLAFDLGVKP